MQTFRMLCRYGLLLWLALAALLVALADPTVRLPRAIHNYLFVIDITQSMNVRDMRISGQPASRLEYLRHLLGQAVGKLPCGTKVGIALFANAEVVPLFTPIDVCADYDALQQTLAHLEWRMAWHGSSRLRFGLKAAVMTQAALREPAQLVFLTDGDEAPPLNAINKIELAGVHGNGWLLAGIGSDRPSPIPKLNAKDETIGYWSIYAAKYEPSQIVNEESLGKRDDSIATNPREYYLSSLQEDYLRKLAQDIGATYVRAESPEKLLEAMTGLPPARRDRAPVRAGWMFALLAGVLLVAEHLPLHAGRRRRPW